jgi:hypothetical protein
MEACRAGGCKKKGSPEGLPFFAVEMVDEV